MIAPQCHAFFFLNNLIDIVSLKGENEHSELHTSTGNLSLHGLNPTNRRYRVKFQRDLHKNHELTRKSLQMNGRLTRMNLISPVVSQSAY